MQPSLRLLPLQASLVQSRIKALERLGESEVVEEDPEFVFKFPPPDTVAPPIMGFNDVSAAGACARQFSCAARQLHGVCQMLCPTEKRLTSRNSGQHCGLWEPAWRCCCSALQSTLQTVSGGIAMLRSAGHCSCHSRNST